MELERLIETERRLDDRLRRAREEAAAIVRDARQSVGNHEAALAAELEAAARTAGATLAAERERVAAEIATEARGRVASYDGVDEPRVQAAAWALVERLLAGGGGA